MSLGGSHAVVVIVATVATAVLSLPSLPRHHHRAAIISTVAAVTVASTAAAVTVVVVLLLLPSPLQLPLPPSSLVVERGADSGNGLYETEAPRAERDA